MIVRPVTLEPVSIQDKLVLRNLLSLYLHDFSELVPCQISDHGTFEYKYLDHYWTEDHRQAYFIKADGHLAGFIMVRGSDTDGTIHSIAEFFVLRGYRRQGVGKTAAHQVFNLYPGTWRVHELAENTAAQAFWRRTINAYTKGQYQEEWSTEENRLVQTFVAP